MRSLNKFNISVCLIISFSLASFGLNAETVITGKIKHNGLDKNESLETIHQLVWWGGALSADWYYMIGENLVPNLSYIHKYGVNDDIDAAVTYETVWSGGGAYTGFNATEAEILEVASSDIADVGALVTSGTVTTASTSALYDSAATFITDGVAVGDVILNDTSLNHGIIINVVSETQLNVFSFIGSDSFLTSSAIGDSYRIATASSTGAAVIELEKLLDGNLDNETREFVILNGTSWVDTIGTYKRGSRAGVILAGSGAANAGTITVRQKTTPANVFMILPIGFNHSLIAAYTIPAGLEGHILKWYVALSGKVSAICVARLIVRHVGEVFAVKEVIAISSSGFERTYTVPKNDLPPGTDIAIEASCNTNNTGVSAGFDIIYGYH